MTDIVMLVIVLAFFGVSLAMPDWFTWLTGESK